MLAEAAHVRLWRVSSAWTEMVREPVPRGRALTLDEWSALPEDEPGELVDGFLMEEELPDPVHELAVSWFVFLFRSWLGRAGFVFTSDLKVQVTGNSGRKPDLTIILPGSARPSKRGILRIVPDVLVEVVTPTPRDERRDRIEKMAEYEALGVRWYWLLDPALGSFEIFELGDRGKYTKVVAASAGRVTDVPGCPGLAVDLDDLWAELDRLEDGEGP